MTTASDLLTEQSKPWVNLQNRVVKAPKYHINTITYPASVYGFGNTSVFEISKAEGHFIFGCTLAATYSPVVTSDASATIGYVPIQNQITRAAWSVGTEDLDILDNDTYLHIRDSISTNSTRFPALTEESGLGASAAARAATAAAAQILYLDLPFGFTKQPFPIAALPDSQSVRVKVNMKPMLKCTQLSTGAATVTTASITSLNLIVSYCVLEGSAVDTFDALRNTIQTSGLYLPSHDRESDQQSVTAGALAFKPTLRNFTGLSKYIVFCVRKQSEVALNNYSNYQDLADYQLSSNGRIFGNQFPTTSKYWRCHMTHVLGLPADFSAATGRGYIFMIPFCTEPLSQLNTGFCDMSTVASPQLAINFNSGLAADVYVDAISITNRLIYMDPKGTVRVVK
jgi:hypothetical protein